MLKIEIEKADVNVKSGVSARNQKQYQIREQNAYVHIPGQKYPQPIKLVLADDQQPYAPGSYTLAPESFFVGRFGDLQCRPRLAPVVARTQGAA
jgi:hypothetical protein